MTKRQANVIIVLLVSLLILVSLGSNLPATGDPGNTAQPVRWEYYVGRIEDVYPTPRDLKDVGNDGWELVAAVPMRVSAHGSADFRLFFKRPLPTASNGGQEPEGVKMEMNGQR